MSHVGLVIRPFLFGKLLETHRGVKMAIVVEISRHAKISEVGRLARDVTLATHAEPTVAGDQPLEPSPEHVVGHQRIIVQSQRQIADLGATQTACGTIDPCSRTVAKVLAVGIREIGVALSVD